MPKSKEYADIPLITFDSEFNWFSNVVTLLFESAWFGNERPEDLFGLFFEVSVFIYIKCSDLFFSATTQQWLSKISDKVK